MPVRRPLLIGSTAPRLRRPLVGAFALLALAVAPGPAGAYAPVPQSRLLWATINVCDTTSHPDTIGIRASMPGDGVASEEMFVRFQAQMLSPKDGTWRALPRGGDSGFVDLGSSRERAREAGRLFVFAPPTGKGFSVRGLVTFEWRQADGTVVRRVRKATTTGHRSAAGADPQGYSADTCLIS
jgi:hypothetical protein